MALLEYIKDQLLFKETVTLPGLGSFEIRRVASRIQGKKIIPPAVLVVFNPEKSLDGGVLAKSISVAEEINQEEAEQKVLEYIDEILFALNKGEDYVFEGFGALSRDSDNVFHFRKDPAYQVEYESYGLESFELDPVEDGHPKEKTNLTETPALKAEVENNRNSGTKKEQKILSGKAGIKNLDGKEGGIANTSESAAGIQSKNNRNIFWILTGALMIILVSFVIIKLSTSLLDGNGLSIFDSGQKDKSSVFPEDENWDVESDLKTELGDAIDSMTLQENALTLQEASEPSDIPFVEETGYSEFHIIAGSFRDKINAGVLQQELTLKGYPALVIQQGENLYRVSAISFKSKEKGLVELSRFKEKTKNNAAWLLKLK